MKLLKQAIIYCLILSMFSCNETTTKSSDNEETANLSIRLVDAPGDYEHIYVEILDVKIKYANQSDDDEEDDNDGGWQSLGIIEPGIYDLLELTAGVSLPLVDNEEVEAGVIKQIRLVLGESNSIVLDGELEERPLNTPSAQQSGLKVFVNQEILPGFNYDFILDFDADESIVIAGNSGNIILKPVLRASLEINSGTIVGEVLPPDLAVAIEASNESNTASTLTDDLGNYEIAGLPEGVYEVIFTPDPDSGFQPVILNDVEVTAGATTVLDPVIFE